jgi:phenylacetate-CoA ligase
MISKNEVYSRLPVVLQHVAVSANGCWINHQRFGKEFEKTYRCYQERERWSHDRLIEYRDAMRREAVRRAAHAPYYQHLFRRMGATWRDFLDEGAFSNLPILSKTALQADIDSFRCRPPATGDKILSTSGTTGASLTLPVSENVEPDQWAVWWRYRGWHGIQRGDRCGLFASAPVVLETKTDRPYRLNWANNEIRFSIFHISPDTAHLYVEALNKYKPSWIHGNPTAIALLARYMNEKGLRVNSIRVVTVGSENLQPWYKQSIIDAFGVTPRQHYGLVEAVANISECEAGKLHVDEDFSYVEFIAEDNQPSYSIVGTNFSNTALSILRYQTGDLVSISEAKCACGRAGRVVSSLDGRETDYIVLPGGRRVASLAAPFHSTEGLAGAQLYQDKEGQLTVRYVPASDWKNEILKGLEARLRLRVGNEVPIFFERVSEITKTSRGKTKLVVSDYTADI